MGVAVTVVDLIGCSRYAFQLVGIERFDIASVILIKVGELIIEQDRSLHVVVDAEP